MLRSTLVSLAVLILVVGTGHAGARPLRPPGPVAQEETAPPEAVRLSPGERFALSETWELEVQGSFATPSPDRARYSEVRVAVGFRNVSPDTILFSRAALAERLDAYPRLRLRDAADVIHHPRLTQPGQGSVPGSDLTSLPPGITARWTLGFQVPTLYDHELAMEAVWDDRVVASWDLRGASVPLSGWSRPAGARAASPGEEVTWGSDLVVSPVAFGTRLCGDPSLEHAVLVLQLNVLVENTSFTDALWPGTRYPEVPAVAVWSDGASAASSYETFPGEEEPLDRHSFEAVVITPHAAPDGGSGAPPEARALIFSLARDGRFGPAAQPPQAVMLLPPSDLIPTEPIWLELTGAQTVTPAATWCDVYQPSIRYRVRR